MSQDKSYIALVTQEADSSFSVHFPDLKYAFTSSSSLENAEAGAHIALATHIGELLQKGAAVPEPSSLDKILAENQTPVVEIIEVGSAPITRAPNSINGPRSR